jgi:hypothetical protein
MRVTCYNYTVNKRTLIAELCEHVPGAVCKQLAVTATSIDHEAASQYIVGQQVNIVCLYATMTTIANRQLAVSDSAVHDTTTALQQARAECANALHTIEQERVAASEALAAAATAHEEELIRRSAAAADAAVEVRHVEMTMMILTALA